MEHRKPGEGEDGWQWISMGANGKVRTVGPVIAPTGARALFEAAAKARFGYPDEMFARWVDRPDEYEIGCVQGRWDMWQDAVASVEGKATVPLENTAEMR